MPELDYRDVRRQDISVADIVEFDAIMARLTDRERDVINRKVAFEQDKAQGNFFSSVDDADDQIEKMSAEQEGFADALAARDNEIKALTARIASLGAALNLAENAAARADHEISEMIAQHGKELQEAEVRGYRRGLDEAQAA